MYMPTHLRAARVQWAITTAEGQETMLTGNDPLPLQPTFGVSMPRDVQEKREGGGGVPPTPVLALWGL